MSKTDEEHAGARLDFKHEAALMLIGKKAKEDQIRFLENMLKDVAMERIGGKLEEHERLLEKDLQNLRMQSFGLGSESISAVAGLELEREKILQEKYYFEKFMDLLIPGSIPKKRKMETEELMDAISGKKDEEKGEDKP